MDHTTSTAADDSLLKIEDLRKGDVLLFSYVRGDPLSMAIAWVTDSTVSHAAMFYDEMRQATVEADSDGIVTCYAADSFENRHIDVLRFNGRLSLEPVLAAAYPYLKAQTPYGHAGFILLAVALLHKKFAPDRVLQMIIAKIIALAARIITAEVDEKKYPGKRPMTCSQFVAQCYDDAGIEYSLFPGRPLFREPQQIQDTDELIASCSLLDRAAYALHHERKIPDETHPPILYREAQQFLPEMSLAECTVESQALVDDLLSMAERTRSLASTAVPDMALGPELLRAILNFAAARHLMLAGDQEMIVYREDAYSFMARLLDDLRKEKNLFVTPVDLFSSVRLDLLGSIPPSG